MNDLFGAVKERQERIKSLLCVGLDPDLDKIPRAYQKQDRPILRFCLDVIDATKDFASCFKPQFAHFAAASATDDLQEVVSILRSEGLPVILDAKRGDVGSTSEFYAHEAFDIYDAGAVTVNPYMGGDSLDPFLEYQDRGVILLCRTSNPGGGDIQNLELASGGQVYERVAFLARDEWNTNKNVGLVVGATRPEELLRVRSIVGDMYLLLPGVGAQGADVREVMRAGSGGGLLVSASRSVLYPKSEGIQNVRLAAKATRDLIASCAA